MLHISGAGVSYLVQQGCGAMVRHCIVQGHAKDYKGKLENLDFLLSYRPECDIRENFDMNECPNIFVSTKLHE